MDKWKDIVKAIEAEFNELITAGVIATFKLGRFEPSKYPHPIVGLIPMSIRTQRTKTHKTESGGASQLFGFTIRAVCDFDETEPIYDNGLFELADTLKQVDIVMSKDPKWGGLATDTMPDEDESTTWPWTDVDLSHAAADKKYVIRYQEEDVIDG